MRSEAVCALFDPHEHTCSSYRRLLVVAELESRSRLCVPVVVSHAQVVPESSSVISVPRCHTYAATWQTRSRIGAVHLLHLGASLLKLRPRVEVCVSFTRLVLSGP